MKKSTKRALTVTLAGGLVFAVVGVADATDVTSGGTKPCSSSQFG
jgi:hypothetical protein